MERRSARVSETQWNILLEFLEQHPNLARARGYNNTNRGRAESKRLWQEIAIRLNSEGSGATKSYKEWAIYVSNYKSKIKKIVADINVDHKGTGGGAPQSKTLSEIDSRFLAVMGLGFGHGTPNARVDPFSNVDLHEPTTTSMAQPLSVPMEDNILHQPIVEQANDNEVKPAPRNPPLPRQPRQRRYRSRPLAPLDGARRILSQVERMQRVEADRATAQALENIGANIGRLADAAERYLTYIGLH